MKTMKANTRRTPLKWLFMVAIIFVMTVGMASTANAWEPSGFTLSNITMNENGNVTGFDLSYKITGNGIGRQAVSMIGVQTKPFATTLTQDEAKTLPWDPNNQVALKKYQSHRLYNSFVSSYYSRYGEFTNIGRINLACQFKTISDIQNYRAFCNYYELNGFSENTFPSFGQYVNISENISFANNPIDMSKDATYYIYMWTLYNGDLYPDAFLGTLEVTDGNLSLKDKNGTDGTVEIPHSHGGITFRSWTDTTSLPDSGNWYLVNNINTSGATLPLVLTGDVNLCFNGKTVSTHHIALSGEHTLTVWDCNSQNPGTLVNTGSPHTIGGGASLVFNDITMNGSVSIGSDGSMTMNSGKITVGSGNAVNVRYSGIFTMNDGEIICPNTSTGNGINMMYGGDPSFPSPTVTVNGGTISKFDYGISNTFGTLTVTGGTITQNRIGIGVGPDYGVLELNLSGGTITDNGGSNRTGNFVGGVVVRGGTFNLSGNPVIKNNNKKDNVAVNLVLFDDVKANIAGALTNTEAIGVTALNAKPYTFTTSYKTTVGATVPSTYFTSDDPNYAVLQDADGEAMLAQPNGIITFYGNMEGTTTIGDAQTAEIGKPLSEINKPADPSKSGYFFAGWTTTKAADAEKGYNYKQAMPDSDKNEDDLKVYPDIRVDFENGTVTGNMNLYPMFIKDRLAVRLNLGAEDAQMASEQSREFTVNIDEKIQMLYVDQSGVIHADKGMLKATRPGYDLDGWYTNKGVLWNGNDWKDATTADKWWPMTPEYADNSTPEKHASRPYNFYTVTLTAHWVPKTVNVEYELNGGTADAQAGSATTQLGGTLTLPGAPTKDSHRFTGWKIGTSPTLHSAGETLEFNDWSLVQSEKLSITAQYIYDPTLYIEFNTNGGSAIEPISATAGTAILIPDDVKDGTAISKIGHTFAGWYKDPGFTEAVNDGDWPIAMPDTNTTFYAKWIVNQYTINFNMNGAESDQIQSITQDYDTDITKPADPTKLHYTFKNWSPAIPDKMPASNLTVEAIWEPTTYTMKFKAHETAVEEAKSGKFGDLVTPPSVTARDNLTFVRWSVSSPIYMPDTNSDEPVKGKWKPNPTAVPETVLGKKDGKITGVTNEMVYKRVGAANWTNVTGTEITGLDAGEYQVRFAAAGDYKSDEFTTVTIAAGSPITVTFDSDGGSGVQDLKIAYNGTIDKPNDPTKKYYDFDGWYYGDETSAWDFDTRVVTTATTLKAHWKETDATEPTARVTDVTLPYGYTSGAVSVTAWAAEDHTLSYQWYSCDASGGSEQKIDAATNTSLSIPAGKAASTTEYYYCEVTATRGDRKTKTVNSPVATVEVVKLASYPAILTANNRTYDGTEKPLATVTDQATGGTMNYALGTDATTVPTQGWDEKLPTGQNAGTYYVWYMVVGDANHVDSDASCVTVNVGKAEVTAPTIKSKIYNGQAQTATVEASALYTITTNEGGTNVGDYEVALTLTDTANYKWTDSEEAVKTLVFTITRADAPEVVVPTPEAVTYDPAKTLESVALPDGWAWADKTTVPTVSNNGYAAEYTVPDDTNYDYSGVDGYDAQTHKVTRTVALTVNKAKSTPATVTANNRNYDGTEKPLVTVSGEATGVEMQYALGTATEATEQYTTSISTATDAGTYYVWYKVTGDGNHTDSEPACVAVTIASADAGGSSSGEGGLVYNGTALKLVKGGSVLGGTLKYALGQDASTAPESGWTGEVPEGTDAGTYYVWYRVDGDKNHNSVAPACVTVTIAKAPAPKTLSAQQKAKAKNSVYKGKQQALVSGPEVLPTGYEKAQYSTDGGKTWRDALPTAKNAGSWSVLVKYVGDKNHEDFTNGPVKASISKAKITIAAQDKKSTRGKALAKLTYKVTGPYVSGDSLGIKLSTTAKKTGKAGKYPITVSWNKNPNYSATVKKGTYTLADAILSSEKKAAKTRMNAGFVVTWDENGILARWGSEDGAQRYEIYAAYCGSENVCKKVATVKADTYSFRLKKMDGKGLNAKKPVKLYVRAYRKVDGTWTRLGHTILAHVVSPGHKKYSNAAKITVSKDSYTLKAGKTAKISAKEVLSDKKKASLSESHGPRFRYKSSNEKVATVSEDGTITAVGKGTCAVYVYARNGRAKKITVTVK